MELLIRNYHPSDLDALRALFRATVREVNCRDYNAIQIEAWSEAANHDDF